MNASYGIARELTLRARELATGPLRSYLVAMRFVTALVFVLSSSGMLAATIRNPLDESRQCVVVVSPGWNSKTGTLRAFEKKQTEWKPRGGSVPVVLGKKGLGWGSGLLQTAGNDGPRKVEGDNKAPAGIFRLGPAFGYASHASWIKLRYVPLTGNTEGIDDPRSHYYNQLVDRTKVRRVDWKSSEKMRRADILYKWGVFVAHNPGATPGAGSLIFLHIWRDSSGATAGCTAMPEKNLVQLLRWLDPAAHPVLVQMPQPDYDSLRTSLRLPRLN